MAHSPFHRYGKTPQTSLPGQMSLAIPQASCHLIPFTSLLSFVLKPVNLFVPTITLLQDRTTLVAQKPLLISSLHS